VQHSGDEGGGASGGLEDETETAALSSLKSNKKIRAEAKATKKEAAKRSNANRYF
jgi:hypothetical protein